MVAKAQSWLAGSVLSSFVIPKLLLFVIIQLKANCGLFHKMEICQLDANVVAFKNRGSCVLKLPRSR